MTLSTMECAVKGMEYREQERKDQAVYDTHTRYLAVAGLICGGLSLAISLILWVY